jgi:hypothetical protein
MARKHKQVPSLFLADDLRAQIMEGKPRTCVERRHMRAAEFMTYSAMYACAMPHRETNGGKLIYTAGDYWLANANNRSVNQEIEARKKLEQEGWIILIEKKLGKANRYEVIEHEAYVAAHPDSCPPMKYVDALMADVTGMEKYGPATREAGAIPDNFSIDKKLREAAEEAGWPAIAEYLRNLSPEIRARIVEHLKQRNQR